MPRMTRREFVKKGALAGMILSGTGQSAVGSRKSSTSKEPGSARVEVAWNGFLIDGKLWPMYSGSFHYWRHDRKLWAALFDNIAGLGLRTITTYIPWSVHEIERGQFDFGQVDARKDIAAFLNLAHSKGFKVLVRPGPHINSELTYFGFPKRVLFDERAQLRTASGARIVLSGTRAFPVPSCASNWFFEEVAVYFDALMPILGKLLHPNGPIIAIQSDNENSFFFHGSLAYSGDYHSDSVTAYRAMLERKYEKSIDKLNRRYGAQYSSFAEVEPPRKFAGMQKESIPYYLDWAEYREHYLTESLNRVGRMFRERGINGIPIFQCTPQGFKTPFDLPAVEAAGVLAWSGINEYTGKQDYLEMKTAARAARGLTRFAEMPEFGGGIWIYAEVPRDPKDTESSSLAAVMHGFKGLNYYMIVERDRWVACPITRDNRRRKGFYETYSKFIHFVRDNHLEDFEKQAHILLLSNFDADRLALTFSRRVEGGVPWSPVVQGMAIWAHPVAMPQVDLGLRCDVKRYGQTLDAAYTALDRSGYDLDFAYTELPLERLKKYRVLGLVTMDFISRSAFVKLRAFVESGGHVVVCPVAPSLNEDLQPDAEIEAFFTGKTKLRKGSVSVAVDAGEFARQVIARAPKPEFSRDNTALDVSVHRSRDGRRKLVFVANPTVLPQTTRLTFAGARSFRDLWGDENLKGQGSVAISLSPYSLGVWEVTPT